ncbi:winged helix-turn-helix domain-containing protein [Qipengyuania sp. GH29]|nr:winged helix-turn-helix domain-containing protein [Qipengyuania sphaerica]
MGAKSFALLQELMQQAGLLVTKDRLFDVGWPDQAVSDAVLTTTIRDLRRALDDRARDPQWIETHHGKGYRFLRNVDPRPVHPGLRAADSGRESGKSAQEEKSSSSSPRIVLVVGICSLLIAIAGIWWVQRDPGPAETRSIASKSVVAMPFRAIGPDATDLASGLDEEISSTLARTPDIELAGGAIVAQVQEAGTGANAVGREAGFGHILSGSVTTEDDTVRVIARLTDTATGREKWSERFDAPSGNILELQENVAFAIASAIGSVMDPQRLRDMTRIGTRSVPAYRAWRQGRELVERAVLNSNPAMMEEARAYYAQALKLDPQFARAHWEAAYMEMVTANTIYSDTSDIGSDTQRRQRYIEHIEAAIAAAPSETDRLLYRAAREMADLNYRQSVRLLEKYLEERPGDEDIWYSLLEQARIAERYDLVEKSIDRIIADTRRGGAYPVIGTNYMDHDPQLALRYAREGMREAPDYTALQFQAHRALLIAGENDQARKLLNRMLDGQLPAAVRDGAQIRQLCADGKVGEARKLAREMLETTSLPIVVKWSSALTAGLDKEANEVLAPLKGRDALFTLSQFLIYREFDARQFPELAAALARGGIKRPLPQKPAYACPGL